MSTKKDFDLVQQELKGNNTIEASAGTGKTYSIAILVVRLILEKQLPIEKILLVTFTEAAAAELKERTVRFIRLALKETDLKGSSKNETIETIVVNCQNLNNTEKQGLLNQALLGIDKATMSTIHSFCQETLTEFAFETGQVFGKELMTDTSEIVELELNEYWRTVVAIGDKALFDAIGIGEIEVWKGALKNALNGQELVGPFVESYAKAGVETCEELIKEFDGRLKEFRDRIISYSSKITKTKEKYLKSGRDFYNYIEGSPKHNFEYIFPKEIQKVNKVSQVGKQIAHDHLNKAIEVIVPKIKRQLEKKNALTYDDLIQSLYVKRKDKQLQKLMRSKYAAIFVDEFQDTDPYQYGTFKTVFQDFKETILFYIGDPKQSIYGWRKADLETYYSARDANDMTPLSMNKNYRSSDKFIQAANDFFKLDKNSLSYIPVEAVNNSKPGLTWTDKSKGDFSSIFIRNNHSNNDKLNESIKEVLRLLFSDQVNLNKKAVQPSNVAVLVRTGKEGKNIKRFLNDLNVPSVVLSEDSIFSSDEALEIKSLLNAVLNISQNNIDGLLLSDLMEVRIEKLFQVDYDTLIPFFYELKSVWENEGVFVMINKFMNEFNLVDKCRACQPVVPVGRHGRRHGQRTGKKESIKGQQKLSNIQQLVDILQSKSLHSSLTPSEQLLFLSHQIKEKPKNDEFEQGIESDEDAVKIMTLHKSKGLEFDIVLLPYLSVEAREESYYTFSNFRKKEAGNKHNTYYFSLKGLNGENEELFKQQLQEENERLLYVGVTRAKYNAIILSKNPSKNGTNLLYPYVKALQDNPSNSIKTEDYKTREDWSHLEINPQNESTQESLPKSFPEMNFPDKNYHKMSYSFLAGSHGSSKKELKGGHKEGSYDNFIFKELAKGAHIGNLLHDIFEFIDFSDNAQWEKQIQRSVQHLLPSRRKDEGFCKNLYKMVEHTVNASIKIDGESFSLSDISRAQRLNEMKFNFPIKEEFKSLSLEYILEKDDPREILTTKSSVRGMMNGFVDLFFEHNDKYYILDWKSNFLGDEISEYDSDGVLNGMNEGNYHLQYLLYTIAVEKFLKSRIGENFDFENHFGGIIYVFLRGTREGQNSGFYVKDVTKSELDKLKGVLFPELTAVQ